MHVPDIILLFMFDVSFYARMFGNTSKVVCLVLVLYGFLAPVSAIPSKIIDKKVKIRETNVTFHCLGDGKHMRHFGWCYVVNCARTFPTCRNSSFPENGSICYCSSSDRWIKTLIFPTTRNMTGKRIDCCGVRLYLVAGKRNRHHVKLPIRFYQIVILKIQKPCVIILGRKRKRLHTEDRNVTFECRSRELKTTVKWCYNANCTRPVDVCLPGSCSLGLQICYCRLEKGVSRLVFPSITEEMEGKYYCYQDKMTKAKSIELVISPTTPHSTTTLKNNNKSSSGSTKTADDQTATWNSSAITTLVAPPLPETTTWTSASTTSVLPILRSISIKTPAPSYSFSARNTILMAVAAFCATTVSVSIIALCLYCRLRQNNNSQTRKTIGLEYEKKWEIKRSQLKIGHAIGEGFFGSVVKAETVGVINGWTKTTVAIKIAHRKHCSDTSGALRDEVALMKKIGRHENVIALIGVCLLNGPLWVVMEYAEHGSLLNYLRSLRPPGTLDSHILKYCVTIHNERVLQEENMWNFAVQIMKGMKHLISHKCIHRDLAARNVLVSKGLQLKICDFGMAKDISYHDYYRRTSPGILPLKWTAPEAAVDKLYTEYSDVWSFGIVLWEIATLGASPYPGLEVLRLIELLTTDSHRMSCPGLCPTSLYSLMTRCWDAVPENRPQFSVMLEEQERVAGHQ